jgi:hypothetical protein
MRNDDKSRPEKGGRNSEWIRNEFEMNWYDKDLKKAVNGRVSQEGDDEICDKILEIGDASWEG